MSPPSSTTIQANKAGNSTQEIFITNSLHKEKNIILKLKLSYKIGDKMVEELSQVSSFPTDY